MVIKSWWFCWNALCETICKLILELLLVLVVVKCICAWTSLQGLIDQLQRNKLLFIETPDAAETTLALINYQKVCRR